MVVISITLGRQLNTRIALPAHNKPHDIIRPSGGD